MSIKAVLFDFDDTLGDREAYAYANYKTAFEERFPELTGIRKEAFIQRCLILDQQGDVNKTYVRDVILKETGYDLGEDFNDWWTDNLWKHTVLFDDALDTVKAVREKGYRTGIITNGTAVEQHKKVEMSGLTEYMDTIVVSGDLGFHKPDVRIYQLAANNLNLKCDECMFIGDLFAKDVIGAYNAGMKPVWFWSHGPRHCENEDVIRIHKISEILEYL